MSNWADQQLDDEEMWVSPPFSVADPLHRGLKDLEKNLRCPICQEFFRSPVSVHPCAHTFCSECVRQTLRASLLSMKRSAHCPVCRVSVDTSGADFTKCLAPNRSVETTTKIFVSVRANLQTALSQQPCACVDAAPADEGEQPDARAARRRRSPVKSYQEDSDEEEENEQQPVVQRKKKRRPHYKNLKKRQLQDLCRTEGLWTSGSEKELKERHEAFVTLYNADSDSFAPRAQAEIVKEIHDREQAKLHEVYRSRSTTANHSQCMEQLKECRKQLGEKSEGVALSSGNQAFDAKLNEGFAKLIAQGRQGNGAKSKSPVAKPGEAKTSNDDQVSGPFSPVAAAPTDTMKPTAADTRAEVSHPPTVSNYPSVDAEDDNMPAPSASAAIASKEKRKSPSSAELKETKKPKPVAVLTTTQSSTTKVTAPGRTRKRKSTSPGGLIGPWSCARCTFLNEKNTWSRAECEMCGQKRNSEPATIAIEG